MSSNREPLVADVLQPNLDVVFCGTALGKRSFQERAYYAHPGNKFWRMLYAVGLTPYRFSPADFRLVVNHRVGLTDLCKTASGNDSDIPREAFDPAATRGKIELHRPQVVAFTSKNAGRIFMGHKTNKEIPYGLQPERINQTRLFVLPSPSGSGSGHWQEKPWYDLAAYLTSQRKKSA